MGKRICGSRAISHCAERGQRPVAGAGFLVWGAASLGSGSGSLYPPASHPCSEAGITLCLDYWGKHLCNSNTYTGVKLLIHWDPPFSLIRPVSEGFAETVPETLTLILTNALGLLFWFSHWTYRVSFSSAWHPCGVSSELRRAAFSCAVSSLSLLSLLSLAFHKVLGHCPSGTEAVASWGSVNNFHWLLQYIKLGSGTVGLIFLKNIALYDHHAWICMFLCAWEK